MSWVAWAYVVCLGIVLAYTAGLFVRIRAVWRLERELDADAGDAMGTHDSQTGRGK